MNSCAHVWGLGYQDYQRSQPRIRLGEDVGVSMREMGEESSPALK